MKNNAKIDNRTLDVYKKIFTMSASILIVILQVFVFLISNGVDIVDFSYIDNAMLRIVLQFMVQIVFFGVIGAVIFFLTDSLTKFMWKKIHSEVYYEGMWLHIHEKDPVRIGTVKITQNFYDLSAEAVNVGVNCKEDEISDTKTNWSYYNAIVDPGGKEGRKGDVRIAGCYIAHKKGSNIYNHGIHLFDDDDPDNGTPYLLKGKFSDVLSLEGVEKNISNKTGKIYLIKMSPAIADYICINGRIDFVKLSNIMEEKSLQDELYISMLKTSLKKTGNTLT